MQDRLYPSTPTADTSLPRIAATAVRGKGTIEERMYDKTPPAPAFAQERAEAVDAIEEKKVEQASEQKPFDPLDNAEIKALRDDPARRMYADTIRPELRSIVPHGDQQRAVAIELSRSAADLGLDSDAINEMTMAGRQLKAVHADGFDEAAWTSMETDARSALAAEFGADKVDEVLAAAQKLVARDPRVRATLESTGLGSDPSTVMRFAKLAWRARS